MGDLEIDIGLKARSAWNRAKITKAAIETENSKDGQEKAGGYLETCKNKGSWKTTFRVGII